VHDYESRYANFLPKKKGNNVESTESQEKKRERDKHMNQSKSAEDVIEIKKVETLQHPKQNEPKLPVNFMFHAQQYEYDLRVCEATKKCGTE